MGKSVLILKMRGLVLFLCLVSFAATQEDGHLDSAEDTIPGHSGSPRIEVQQSINSRTSGCANMPSYMLSSDRIVGGVDAPTPIPWHVSVNRLQVGNPLEPARPKNLAEARSETLPHSFGIQILDLNTIPAHWIMTSLSLNWTVLWN